MPKTPRYTIAQIADALEATAGIRKYAAKRLRCSPATIKNYIDRHKTLRDLEAQIVEDNLDTAEAQVLKAIHDGDLVAVMFYLRTKGSQRGYSQRYQIEGKDGGPVELKHQVDFSKLSPAGLEIAQAMLEQLREGNAD